jgi:hypothetical protein
MLCNELSQMLNQALLGAPGPAQCGAELVVLAAAQAAYLAESDERLRELIKRLAVAE